MKLNMSIVLFTLFCSFQINLDKRVVVLAATEENSALKNQIEWLNKHTMQLEKRRIAVFTLIDGEVTPLINSSEKAKAFVEKSKTNYTETKQPKTYLIGLDSSILRVYNNGFQAQNMFSIIDNSQIRY